MRKATIVVSCLAAIACGPDDPGRAVVAVVGDQSIRLTELEGYLQANLVPVDRDDEPVSALESDSVRSRLLDALIDNVLLARESERRGLTVDERDIDRQLEQGVGEVESAFRREDRRAWARRQLAAQALEERVAADLVAIDDAELQAYMAENPEPTIREERLVLRGLTFPSLEDALRVRSQIVEGHDTFTGAVSRYATSESDGVPVEIAWPKLPETIRGALRHLEPRRVSPAVEYEGHAYLFEIEAWLTKKPETEAVRLERAREDLARLRQSWAIDALLQKLRASTVISIRRSQLPFRYRDPS